MELGKIYVSIDADAKAAIAEIKQLKGRIKSEVKEMASEMKRLQVGFDKVGTVGRKSFLTLGAAMTGSIVVASKFESSMANVNTMLSGTSEKYLPEYAAGLKKMSVEFGESTGTLSKGLYDILSASIAPAKAMDVLSVSATAAAAGLTTTGVAADAITTLLNSYGLAAEDAESVSDMLFATVLRGKTTFAELAPQIGLVASTASQVGLTLEELSASLATATRNGVNTSIAVTGLNSLLMAFVKSSGSAKEAAEKYGIELSSEWLKANGLTGVLERLKDARAEDVAAIFENIRGLKVLNPLLGDQTGFMDDLAVATDRAGLSQEAYAKQTAKFEFQIKQLKEAFNVLLIEMGSLFTESESGASIIETLKNKFVSLSGSINAMSPGLKKWTVGLSAGALGVSALMVVLGKLGPAFVVGSKGMWKLIASTGKLIGSLGSLSVAIGAVAAAWMIHEHYFNIAKNSIDRANASIGKATANILANQKMLEGLGRIAENAFDGTNILQIFDKMAPKIAAAGASMAGLREEVIKSDGSIYGLQDTVNKALQGTDHYAMVINGQFRVIKKATEEATESAEEYGESSVDALSSAMALLEDNAALAEELGYHIGGTVSSMEDLGSAISETNIAMEKAWAAGDYKEFLALLEYRIELEEKVKQNAEDIGDKYADMYDRIQRDSHASTETVLSLIDQEMAKHGENTDDYIALQKLKTEYTAQAASEMTQIWGNFNDSIKSSFSTAIGDMIKGTSDLKDAFKNLGESIKNSFIDAFAETLVKKSGFDMVLQGNILDIGGWFGGLGTGITGNFEGIFGGITSGFESIFGGGAAAGAAAMPTTPFMSWAGVYAVAPATPFMSVPATAAPGIVAAPGAAVSSGAFSSGMAGAGGALSLASLGLGAGVLGLGMGVAYLTGAFDEVHTEYDQWFEALQKVQYVGDQNAQNSIATLDKMVNVTKEFDFVLDEDISKRNLWYQHYVESTGAFSEDQEKQARMILGIYENAADKAELVASGFDMGRTLEEDANNWRNQSQEIIDSIAAAGTSAEAFAEKTQESINYWMGHDQRDQMPLEGVLSNVEGMTNEFAESLAREIELMDDWAIHQFELNDDFINELIGGTPGMTQLGATTSQTAGGMIRADTRENAFDISSIQAEIDEIAAALGYVGFNLGQLNEQQATSVLELIDAQDTAANKQRLIGKSAEETRQALLEMSGALQMTESEFNQLADEQKNFVAALSGFNFDDYIGPISWNDFIDQVNLNNYVIAADSTIPEYALGTNYAPGGLALVGELGPEIVDIPRGSRVIPNHMIGGGPKIDNLTVKVYGGIHTQAAFDDVDEQMARGLKKALARV
jgi:TP901 family phage tail tape measure protein